MYSPHCLIVAAIGALIGLILPYVFKVILFISRCFRKHYLEGIWYEYHLNFMDDTSVLKKEVWRIKKGFLEKLVIRTNSVPDGKQKYKGVIYSERGHLVVKFKATTHLEEVFCRFPSPIPLHSKQIVGL